MCFENLDLVLDGLAVAKFAVDVWQGKFSRYLKEFEPRFGPQQRPPEHQLAERDREV